MDWLLSFSAEHFDLPILDWIAETLHCVFLDFLMPIITVLGNAGIFWIAVAVVLLLIPKYRKIGLGMGVSLIIGLLVCNVTLKPLIARPRPYDYQLSHFGKTVELLIAAPHDFSFPSGHTLASFEGATVLLIGNKKLGIPAMVLACLIAFSRLYLYVHYPTDVLVAVVMGIGFGFLGNWLVNKGYAYFSRRQKNLL